MLDTFEYLLGITHQLEARRQNKALKQQTVVEKQQERLQELWIGEQKIGDECVFCGDELGSKDYSLLLAHLIYMPQQDAYL